ncbi:MAG: cold shock and DUF1294 domain-containing protein [Woeseiaceae bacterium]|nr:cold shock and DUF1294 domain-containing protein [Woeseiaceae bacterium]
MRSRGKLADWDDDKGYGFIVPLAGGPRVFVHISAFGKRYRRPVNGDEISYSIAKDENGRTRAANAKILGTGSPRKIPFGPATPAIIVSTVFLAFVGLSVTAGRLPAWVLTGYLAASAVTFIVYAYDKWAARTGRWRTREGTLHLLALAGGWPGAWIAQQALRHKSRKTSFRVFFWATVFINCAGLVWLHTSDGQAGLGQVFGASTEIWNVSAEHIVQTRGIVAGNRLTSGARCGTVLATR